MINEQGQVVEQKTDNLTAPPSTAPADNVASQAQEKMVPQSKVNELIGHAKREAAERARQQALTELQTQQQNSQSNQSSTPIGPSTEEIRKMVQEEADRRLQEEQRKMQADQEKQAAEEFGRKLGAVKDNYPDFVDTVSKLDLGNNQHIAYWANSLPNTAEIIYEMGKNPSKYANVLMLSLTAPNAAYDELRKLSNSITQNKEAVKENSAPKPLSQIKPSVTGTDNGSMTISDLRRQPNLRA